MVPSRKKAAAARRGVPVLKLERTKRLLIPTGSWIGKRVNGVPILDQKHLTQRGGTCMLNSIATMLNAKLRLKYAMRGQRVPHTFYPPSSRWIYNCRRPITPKQMFGKIKRVGLPISKSTINPSSYEEWSSVKGYARRWKPHHVSELRKKLMDRREGEGGPFVGVFLPDDAFPMTHFPAKMIYQSGRAGYRNNEDRTHHMVTIVGSGKEVIRSFWSDGSETDEMRSRYWEFQNSYGPDYGMGKIDVDSITDAYTFTLR